MIKLFFGCQLDIFNILGVTFFLHSISAHVIFLLNIQNLSKPHDTVLFYNSFSEHKMGCDTSLGVMSCYEFFSLLVNEINGNNELQQWFR